MAKKLKTPSRKRITGNIPLMQNFPKSAEKPLVSEEYSAPLLSKNSPPCHFVVRLTVEPMGYYNITVQGQVAGQADCFNLTISPDLHLKLAKDLMLRAKNFLKDTTHPSLLPPSSPETPITSEPSSENLLRQWLLGLGIPLSQHTEALLKSATLARSKRELSLLLQVPTQPWP